ncbi:MULTISPECIES: CRISPR-associated ring nuclease [unclassified Pseudoalteromonas]|jgi:CRISPR-associated protein (TIGR02584 family)|uniref:CRISPR-associated ring nuclease n=1 Tax=unclassified Pseudoalteromonas TaxID=194690 RepID=UPI00257E6951|nr:MULTISPECIES: CRISPR-associated ring nuclease [unclassified Pseudoalteromonas]|tara:strand:- start:12233 stop:12517 length:285 start_codon:yes stop_codon:yes gene_type:complete
MKNVLLIVTGASPQVLTKTLFALYQQGKPMPEEVFVITTKSTKAMLTYGLFEQGHLAKLIADYHFAVIKFLHILLLNSPNREAFSGELQRYFKK